MTTPSIFTTSRLAEFCSQKELVNQTGHSVADWPLVILKELVDNALDACEEASIEPVIEIAVSDNGIVVADNGPGMAPDTVVAILDYNARVSSREAYCSPTRGARGAEPVKWTIAATDPAWRKWRPSDPTSAHWYDDARIGRLMAAYIAYDQDHDLPPRTVRAFVSEFRGLSGTAKARDICEVVGASRLSLGEFYGDGKNACVGALLCEMRRQSRSIKPRELGLIGDDHLRAKFESLGVATESFCYKKAEIEHDGVPYLVEAAFGYCPEGDDDRQILTGINWSVAIGGNSFRNLGVAGESLDSILTEQRAGSHEPIVVFAHVASPCVPYLDRGKSSANLPVPVGQSIIDLVLGVTKSWSKQRKVEERDANAKTRREDRLIRRDRPISIKDAAYRVMEQAYMAASANGTLPANPRQIMYAARPSILATTGKDSLNSQYFCQTLLVDYIQERNLDWDIAWDDRGHFVEPHTGESFGLGTLNVRDYVGTYSSPSLIEAGFADAAIKTNGPEGRYGAMLYIEKEGFMPLLERAQLAEKFDIGIMSCKGMSVTAARRLVDRTCARYGIPLLILHDFDVSGFSIAKTLASDTRRYVFKSDFKPVDLGLRLNDVRDLNLEAEPVVLSANSHKIRETLRRNGANKAEIDFLLSGRRVELNAMTSDQFLAFVESKLVAADIEKIVPPKNQLDETYRLFVRSERIEHAVEEVIAGLGDIEEAVPDDLEAMVRDYLAENPEEPWENAVRNVVELD